LEFDGTLRALVGTALLSQRPDGGGDVLDRFLAGLDGAAGRLTEICSGLGTVPEAKEDEFMGCYTKVKGHMMSRTIFTRGDDEYGKGMLGIGPDFTTPGGLICILLGCDAPVLLREKKRGEGKYMFVGDAHVQGFMEGGGIAELDEGAYELVDFAIA
jgi:hypothetical protein